MRFCKKNKLISMAIGMVMAFTAMVGPTSAVPGDNAASKSAATQAAATSNIKFAGCRSSNYGIEPFPSPKAWGKSIGTMASYFPDSQPVGVWLVGEVNFSNKGMDVEFPSDGKTYPLINFAKTDKHEAYLNYFDQAGIKVYLQLEPGNADINTLIDLVLNRYGKHPSVIGLGIDVEWYKYAGEDKKTNEVVTDALAKEWEARVKSHNSSYKLFLKHFFMNNLPPKYRGDIVFVYDGERHGSFNAFMKNMTNFANNYYPSPVFYQIGYPSDKTWWGTFENPPKYLGEQLSAKSKKDQDIGIIWVDFSLKDVLPYDEATNTPNKKTPTPTPTSTPTPTEEPKTVKVSGYLAPDFKITANADKLLSGFNAKVLDEGISAATDATGFFELKGVPKGKEITVEFSKPGYLTRVTKKFSIQSDTRLGSQAEPMILLAGDLNKDEAINMTDVLQAAKSFGAAKGEAKYDGISDLNLDEVINMNDVMIVAKNFGKVKESYPVLP